MLRHFDLFSGIGGFALGFRWAGGIETVGFCEIDPYCQRVLARHWPGVPIHDDIRTLDAATIGPVDIITGGYPCQPFSTAGRRRGAEDNRHLWPEMRRLVDECRPAWVVGENVAGHISMGLDDVLSDLEALGYAARTFAVPAVAVDAQHRRMRLWIVANANSRNGSRRKIFSGNILQARDGRAAGASIADYERPTALADAERIGPSRQGRAGNAGHSTPGGDRQATDPFNACRWLPEPDVGRVAHGIPARVDRLRALGNAVVPQIPEMIGRAIVAAHGEIAA